MRFANASDRALDFVLDGLHCKVDVGGTVEIPDRMAQAIVPRGLPLVPVVEPLEPEPVDVEPTAEVTKRPGRSRKQQ